MAIHRTTDAQIEDGQQKLSLILEGEPDEQKADRPAAAARVLNAEAINKLLIASAFDFAGRTWTIPVLPFRDGTEMLRCRMEAERIGKYVASGMLMDEYEALCVRVATRLWALVVPQGGWTLWERVRRRFGWMPNPFLRMSDAELNDALTFCLMRRTTSSVRIGESADSASERSARTRL